MTEHDTIPNASVSLTPEQFAHLGGGMIAYVRPIKSEDAQRLFPQIGDIQPGLDLFALLSADGTPIILTDSKDAAIANAWEHSLQTVSLH
ncbi:DUF1150 domain-containing protein [Methylocella sp. CPCC 101449]|jgi:hypothetical protein|uniref:BQ00720 family protein n=1 Tax=Methylocella sp. CPCC 101449 TaxID=2987531 RepID=UPI00288EA27E|nr:DUF1150 domain-containing protein [Methylocella sp. CPCC 101449]MDT2020315.1 DUF1150 domain-containing protein [Methylocella sp. CPCC 101449]HEV2574746.1 DUF1150 domain-containing protein [Beijerinckiaceae bacterium]